MPVKELSLPLCFRVKDLFVSRARPSNGHKCHECGCLVPRGEECYLVYEWKDGRLGVPYAVHIACAPGHFNLKGVTYDENYQTS